MSERSAEMTGFVYLNDIAQQDICLDLTLDWVGDQEPYAVLTVSIQKISTKWFIHGSRQEITECIDKLLHKLHEATWKLKKEVKRLENKNESGQEDKRSSEV